MQLIGRYNKGFQFKLYVIDIFSKYAWVIPLKDKKCIAITNGFQKMLDESNCKPNKVLLDKGSEFYNRPVKSWLQDNDMEMYSTHNEGKLVDIVNEYDNAYHRTIKMKPVDVISSTLWCRK